MRSRRFVPPLLLAVVLIAVIVRGMAAPRTSGLWTPAGTMSEPRSAAAVAVLDDGRVLVTGGHGAAGVMTSVEIYNAGAGFAMRAPMHVARQHHVAVRLADGRVLVAGGVTEDGETSSPETSSPETSSPETSSPETSSAEIYDPASDTWSPAGDMVHARSSHTASLLEDGRVVVAGGEQDGVALNTLELFDPATLSFTAVASPMAPRTGHAAVTLADGRVLLAGGSDSAGPLASISIFDPVSGTIVESGLTMARVGASATRLLDGTVLIAGGNDGTQDLASAELFNPATSSSTPAGVMGTARSGHQAFLLPDNNSVLLTGGVSAGQPVLAAELFVPWTGEFVITGAPQQARSGATGAALQARAQVVVAGGRNAEGALASAERYAFATVKTDKDDYAPGETVTITGDGWEAGETVTLHLHEAPHALSHDDRELTVVADSNGHIINQEFAPEPHDVGVRFYLTAAGAESQAQTTFTDGEIVTSELVGTVNDVTVTQGQSASFTILVSVTGNLRCVATQANPATATVRTQYAISAAGVVSSSTPSAPLAFFAGAPQGGPNCNVTWTGDPAPYSVAASVSAAATTPVGNYAIVLSAPAGTTVVSTPGSNGAPLTDATATTIAVHVVAPADSTPPVIQPTVSGTAGSNGWYVSNVSVTWSVTDPESSISSSSGCGASSVTTDTTGTTFTCTATSTGGTSTKSVTVKRDITPPTASLAISAGTAGANGWYTTDVTVSTTGSDTISSPVTCSADQHQTTETAGTPFNGSCTNDAGLTTQAAPLIVKVDKTGPTATLAVTAGTAGTNGWYTSDVTVGTSGTDSISAPVTCSADQQQTTETAGTPFNGSCTNAAGLTTQAAVLTVKVDKTGPTATLTVTAGTAGTNGWYTSDVTIGASGTDSISAPVTCSADQHQTTETAGVTFNGSCTNDAGITTKAAALVVKVDKTGPTASLAVTAGTAGTHGWYTSDVTIAASGADSISTPVTCSADQHQTVETAGTPFNGSCTNAAGLTTQAAALVVKVDKTGPSATLAVTAGTPGANGWYTSDVTVGTSGSDSVSAPVTCSADQHQAMETAGAPFNGSCTNDAGLTTHAAVLTVKVDKTGPVGVASTVTAGTPGANGWYVSDVTVHTTGTEDISGPVDCTSDQTVALETPGHDVSGSCTNQAGLTAQAAPLTVKVDKTGPSATLAVTAGTAGANGWYTSDVTVGTSGSDSISAPVTCSADQHQMLETAGAPFNGSCTNDAGLTTHAAVLTVKVDKTGPVGVVSTVTMGTPGANGWYVSDVTVHSSGTEDISGPVDCTSDQTVTLETPGHDVSAGCTNQAGLTTQAAPLVLKIDKTGPTAVMAVTAGTPGANGWFTSNVTVGTTGSDTVASPVTCTGDQYQSMETPGTLFNGSCTNDAGLVTQASPLTVRVDKTAPSAVLSAVGTAGLNGWFISAVTVMTTGADTVSGPVVCSAPQTQTADTPGTVFNGTCTNNAGLQAHAAALSVKVDQTAPVINVVAPASGGSYLLNASVPTSYACTDATSGVASCAGPVASGSNLATGMVGPRTFVTTATDRAGNTSTVTTGYDVKFATTACLGESGHAVLQPINADGTSVFKQKSTVPVKFRVCDANGVSIGANTVSSFNLVQVVSGTATSVVNEPVDSTTPDANFRWDPQAQQWIFNTNTKALTVGRTYGFVIALTDSTTIQYQFGLR